MPGLKSMDSVRLMVSGRRKERPQHASSRTLGDDVRENARRCDFPGRPIPGAGPWLRGNRANPSQCHHELSRLNVPYRIREKPKSQSGENAMVKMQTTAEPNRGLSCAPNHFAIRHSRKTTRGASVPEQKRTKQLIQPPARGRISRLHATKVRHPRLDGGNRLTETAVTS